MKKKLMGVALASVLCSGISVSADAGDKLLLKIPYAFNPKLPNISATADVLGTDLPAMTNNSIKVKIYAPGKLVPAFEILDAVSTGKVNAGFATSGYWAGKMPAAPLFSSIPFGPDHMEYAAWYYGGNGASLHQEMYDQAGFNVRSMACGLMSSGTAGWFAKPMDTVEDFKGLKVRTFGLGARVVEKLGASPTLLPVAEIYPALEKGAIDAAEVSNPAIEKMLGFYKVVKYNYFPGWQKQSLIFELMLNKDVWNGMKPFQQKAIEVSCKSAMMASMAAGEAGQFAAMIENETKSGVKNLQFKPEILAALKSAWQQVATEESEKDAFFKKAYDDLTKFRNGYRTWSSKVFLPRTAN